MGKARVIIIGTDPGAERYVSFALRHPRMLGIAGIASADTKRRDYIAAKCSIPSHCRFSSWEEILERPCFADAAVIAAGSGAGDPAVAALECGYRLRIEHPEALDEAHCRSILHLSGKKGIHISAFNPLFADQAVSRALDIIGGGELGDVSTASYEEHISLRTLSFIVREGVNAADCRVAEACRGFSLLSRFIGSEPASVSSFEGESASDTANAPYSRAERCGICPSRDRCRFDSERLHIRRRLSQFDGDITYSSHESDSRRSELRRKIKRGALGRCIFDAEQRIHDCLSHVAFRDSRTARFQRITGLDHDGRLVRISAAEGSVEIIPGAAIIIRRRHEAEKIIQSVPSFALQRKLTDDDTGRFADSIAGTVPLCTPEEALRGRLLSLAAERSRRERGPALLPIQGD